MGHSLLYQAYLLRLWRESREMPWRAALEDSHSGERQAFASLEELFVFLLAQTELSDTEEQRQGRYGE